jgi:CRP/FNR family transcriptional regulator, cyclic AMP receptor protein
VDVAGGEVVPVLDAVAAPERSALLRVGVRRRFAPGEVVFHEGDPGDALHFVTHGVFVARSSSPRGEVIAVNVHGPGDVFGELALLTESTRRSATIVSVERGATLMVGRAAFEDLRARDPSVDRALLTVLAERNRALTAQVVELLFTPADQRVYRRLLAYHEMVAAAEDSGGWIRLNQTELSTLAGTTRSTTNRVLRRAEDGGILALGRGRVRVIDIDELRRRAGS